MAERFTEHSLLDDVIATWGQYGAHADLCRWLIDEVARLRAAADEIDRLRTRETELDTLRVRLTEALCSEMELADLLADELGKVAPSRIAGQMSALDVWKQARG